MASASLPLLELAAKHAVPMLAMLELAVAVLELAVVAVSVLELAMATIAMAVTTVAVAAMAKASISPMSTVPAVAMGKLVRSISSCRGGGTSSENGSHPHVVSPTMAAAMSLVR